MAKPKPLPSVEYLRECFTYNRRTGVLRWRKRPLSHFKATQHRSALYVMNHWNPRWAGQPAGYPSKKWMDVRVDWKHYKVHRIIWKICTGEEPLDEIDHRDTNPFNNRWPNLRPATPTQSMRNRRVQRNNQVGFKGVMQRDNHNDRFVAKTRVNKKTIWLGTYPTPELAHAAYCKAAREHFGEFWNPG